MLHRHVILNTALLAIVLAVTASCTAAVERINQPDSDPTRAALLLPTPTPAPEPMRLPTPTPAPTPPTMVDPADLTLNLTPVVEGLSRPLFVTHAGDGSDRLFIVEKTGAIRVLQGGALLPTPLLDLSSQVSSGSEQGLLGLAFPPNFAATGHFFVNYTDRQGATQIARFQVSAADPNRADPASEFSVLTLAQPAGNHNGGMLAFGPDGMLYIGTGDGGGRNDVYGNGQNPATLLGKMLRLDVTSAPDQPYRVPADNPVDRGRLERAGCAR
jgi:glucose/arabinose dehydrogenase